MGCLLGAQAFAQVNVNMPYNTGVFNTFAIAPPATCSFNFFDNNCPATNYSNSSNPLTSIVTFAPSNATSKVRATFSAFQTETSWDGLYVYDGTLASVPNITNAGIATVIPGQIASANPATFTFRAGSGGAL